MSKQTAQANRNETDQPVSEQSKLAIFDCHFHIIDPKFPLFENNGYMPMPFTLQDYLACTSHYQLKGGAIVSGSFQQFDQSYLINALKHFGPSFVGVTQVPNTITDEEIIKLDQAGIRAVRFNLKRGGSEDVKHLQTMAKRVYEIAQWHVELYVDSKNLEALSSSLIKLPSVSIDHLGLSFDGFNTLCGLVDKNIRVKATGFSRVDFDVAGAIKQLHTINPNALMFGTDLPSTRAPKAYSDRDLELVLDTLDENEVKAVLCGNALEFYRL